MNPDERPEPMEAPAAGSQPAEATPATQPGQAVAYKSKKSHKKLWLLLIVVLLAAAVGGGYWLGKHKTVKLAVVTTSSPKKSSARQSKLPGLQLDPTKNYGDKYVNGLLPVGDGKYSTSGAAAGTVYVCSQYAQNLGQAQGGAGTRGPWFTNNNTQYDINKKAHVSGSVVWQSSFNNTVSGNTRNIVTNDLPSHPTGVFPIAASDTAYAYDRNPNSIKSQALTYALPAAPSYGSPNCMGGEAGVMLTGVALFNAFDAGGRDAGAWEVQDSCGGHPQKSGEYHYHTLSSCIKDISVHTVIGFALDGFPITGPQVAPGNILTTGDLDQCHGLTSQISLDGKSATMYHYVMTQDFPYSVSCFRGQAIQPPGQPG